MSETINLQQKKLAFALLRVARTNSAIIHTLSLLQNRLAPDDQVIKDAIDSTMTRFDDQLTALEDAIDG